MPRLQLDRLVAHPENANVMPAALFAKLTAHIREAGQYPPIIVRSHPTEPNQWQVLDGHHRAKALRAIGATDAHCEIWEVDDHRARVLLLTLNRLQGSDDPERRGRLLRELAEVDDAAELARLLPDDEARIEKLIALTHPPTAPVPPRNTDSMPEAVTFFLPGPARRALLARLKEIHADRAIALLMIAGIDHCSMSEKALA